MDIASWRSWVPAVRIQCVCMLEEHTHIHMMVVRRRRTNNDVSSLTVPSELQQWIVGISLGEGILLSSRQIEVVHGHGDAADACSAVERWWEGGKCERQQTEGQSMLCSCYCSSVTFVSEQVTQDGCQGSLPTTLVKLQSCCSAIR